jgi:GH15 family glucan-1,4-alpha-glucosidase
MSERYKPLSEYAAIGNLRSVALIGRDGSVDWCCFPDMDSSSVFAALLDAGKGGRFRVSLKGAGQGEQCYRGDTNILETVFRDGAREIVVTDLMPLSGDIHGCARSQALPEVHRIIECRGEDAVVEVEWSPRFDYARSLARIERVNGGWLARGGGARIALGGAVEGVCETTAAGDTLTASIPMKKGDRRVLITRWNSDDVSAPLEDSLRQRDETARLWEEWAHQENASHSEEWAGEWLPMVVRSELVFKMLSYADTGALVAAPTTSLPESLGGVRNWDYRFAWIRDASLTAQALTAIGHGEEALRLLHWMEDITSRSYEEGWSIQIMYGIRGESDLDEEELPHLEGYRGSRPVRVGNGAAKQLQLETFGEILNTAYELVRREHTLSPEICRFLRRVTNYVYSVWQEPDHGIWEMRTGLRHFTYSKVMAWVAFDRAVSLAERHSMPGDVEKWRTARDKARAQILEHGFSREVGAFTLAYDSADLDAAALRIPLLGFLPFEDPRVQGTIDRIKEHLMENGFVFRYKTDDGLPGGEGAFNLCTFWLIDALALSGRIGEARELFVNMVRKANHVGLFSEEIDPETGAFLGNFPQAFTHIGLINSAIFLAHAQGREVPGMEPMKTLSEESPAVAR